MKRSILAIAVLATLAGCAPSAPPSQIAVASFPPALLGKTLQVPTNWGQPIELTFQQDGQSVAVTGGALILRVSSASVQGSTLTVSSKVSVFGIRNCQIIVDLATRSGQARVDDCYTNCSSDFTNAPLI